MFGLGGEKKGAEPFSFDLEQDLIKHPEKAKKLRTQTQERIGDIKNKLREGGSQEDIDQYGILLQGYVALDKILDKIEHIKTQK